MYRFGASGLLTGVIERYAIQQKQQTLHRDLRTTIFIAPPKSFGVGPCPCGETGLEWSRFQGMVWCPTCQADEVPLAAGALADPRQLLKGATEGRFCLDRRIVADGRVQVFDFTTGRWK